MNQVTGHASIVRSLDGTPGYWMSLGVSYPVGHTISEVNIYTEDLSQDAAVKTFSKILRCMYRSHVPQMEVIFTTGEYPFTASRFIQKLRAEGIEHKCLAAAG